MAPLVEASAETCEALTQADADQLFEQGYVVVRRVLSAENCDALREHVLLTTDEAARQGRNDLFGNIQEADRRYDLKLDLCSPVVEALNGFVARCGSLLQQAVKGNARVVELAAISSDGGAVAQPVHADTMHGVTRFLQSDIQLPEFDEHYEDDDEDDDIGKIVQAVATETAMIYTALVALQDIEPDMGPTHVWPGTNTVEHHATLWGTHIAGKLSVEEADKAFGVAHKKMTLKRGDLVLYDSRTMHCGGANCSEKRRSVMCISVMGPGIRPDGTTWTLLKSLRNKLSVSSFPKSSGNAPHNTAESTEVVLPPPQQADVTSSKVAAGAVGGKSDGEWKPLPPLDDWAAAVQCTLCTKWRPCSATEAPKLMGLENGFQCPLVGFSCMQDQVYSTAQIDEALA